jgi:predicted metal-dependent hydrolase
MITAIAPRFFVDLVQATLRQVRHTHARQRVDGVINLGGSYETARAQSVGRIVAREVMP